MYKVGKYTIVPEKPFSSMEDAVQHIQKRHPELDHDTIERYLSPKIIENGKDQSGDIHEAIEVSEEVNSKVGSKGSDRIKVGKN
ncbi:hypothetical protein [Chryseobacterium sp. M5A1_1a]